MWDIVTKRLFALSHNPSCRIAVEESICVVPSRLPGLLSDRCTRGSSTDPKPNDVNLSYSRGRRKRNRF